MAFIYHETWQFWKNFLHFWTFFRFFPLLSKLYWTVVCTLLCMQTTKYIILWTKWQSCQGIFLLQCKKEEEVEGGLSNVHFSDERKRVFWWNITSSLMIQITQKYISASWYCFTSHLVGSKSPFWYVGKGNMIKWN